MEDILPTNGFSGLLSHFVENSLWVSKGIFRTPLPSINPTALLKLRIIACRGFSGSKLAEGLRPPSSSRPPNVLFFHKRTTDFLRNTMTATNPDNIATMGISTSPFGLPIPEKTLTRPPKAWGATPNAPVVPETGGREPILGAVKGRAGGRASNGPGSVRDEELKNWRIWLASGPTSHGRLWSPAGLTAHPVAR